MNERENLHAGHRSKMLAKFLNNKDALLDHEILEMVLFNSIRRKNTNDIVHRLLNRFGSLQEIFNADIDDLMCVEGVGKKTACDIALYGEMFNRLKISESKEKPVIWSSFANCKNALVQFFNDLKDEVFLLVVLNAKHKKIGQTIFTDDLNSTVSIEIPSVANAISKQDAKYAIISHNHPSGNVLPSLEDDTTTARIYALCYIHGITLLDHIIISGNNAYSYEREDRLNYVCDSLRVKELINKIEQKTY